MDEEDDEENGGDSDTERGRVAGAAELRYVEFGTFV